MDRGWSYSDFNNYKPNWTTISTPLTVKAGLTYKLPSVVMSTAITPTKASDPLIYEWSTLGENKSFYAFLHFAEVQKLKAKEYRAFDINLNGELFNGPVVPEYLSAFTIYSAAPLAIPTDTFGGYNFTLVKRKNSTLPPILNAIELYTSIDFSQLDTNEDDGT